MFLPRGSLVITVMALRLCDVLYRFQRVFRARYWVITVGKNQRNISLIRLSDFPQKFTLGQKFAACISHREASGIPVPILGGLL
jgi:hypothetical protein